MSRKEINTPNDLERLHVSVSKEAAGLLSSLLSDLSDNYPRDIQGPLPPFIINKLDSLPKLFEDAIYSSKDERVSLDLNFLDIVDIAGLVYFFPCKGEGELILGRKAIEPWVPFHLAVLDLNEAFVKAGGKDNPTLRNTFEALGKHESENENH